jgi:tRNA(fMet)-specific endonuclease VapC
VSGRSELLLLDTNIVIHLIRDNEIGRRVDASFQIRHRPDRPLISIVTVGECLSLVRQFRWGRPKVEALEALLRELVIVPIDSRPVLERFGEFHAWMKSIGRAVAHNDLWIAATAAATGAHLIHERRRL